MLRSTCAVLGLLALIAPAPPEVDAIEFAKAFKAGAADRYNNRQVGGSGISFHGAVQERLADGSTRTSLVITLGAAPPDGPIAPILTWEEFSAAERSRTTLVIALSGPNLPAVPAEPAKVRFSGVYDGQVRSVVRLPHPDTAHVDVGACPGEQSTRPEVAGVYCAPLLTGATATIVPR